MTSVCEGEGRTQKHESLTQFLLLCVCASLRLKQRLALSAVQGHTHTLGQWIGAVLYQLDTEP